MKKSLFKKLIALSFSLVALALMAVDFPAYGGNTDEGEISDDPIVINCPGGPKVCARINVAVNEVHIFYEPFEE